MTDTTPYDNDRNELSRSALARLVLSDRAVALAQTAGTLAVTRYDAYTGPGGRASEALSLTRIADRLLCYAVVYERERGSSWEEIAQYLDMDAVTAEERFAPEIERWNTAFAVPYRLDETGRKRIPNLPTAAYDPQSACRRLDLWAHVHLTISDKHAVSDGLRPSSLKDEPSASTAHDIDGWICRRNFSPFMESLSRYVGTDWEPTDWDTVALSLEGTDDSDPDNGWYVHRMAGAWQSIEVRLANAAAATDMVSVIVAGAEAAELRLRIDTLLSAFAIEP
ncbi:hypothetical protein [Streptomyces sp. NPDC005970]|uniref:hypothetical protein n=1 Tax=Streptomyces sp. NPDC005970 TaxID=3156723 RepID=UPI0033D9DA2F